MNSSTSSRMTFCLLIVGGVAVPERNTTVLEAQDAMVRDRDAMGVGAEVREHALGTGERRFRVDDPVEAAKRYGRAPERRCRRRAFPALEGTSETLRGIFARNTLDRARTGNRKPLWRGVTKPCWSTRQCACVTTQCRWGWSERFWAQVWRIAVMPSLPPVRDVFAEK